VPCGGRCAPARARAIQPELEYTDIINAFIESQLTAQKSRVTMQYTYCYVDLSCLITTAYIQKEAANVWDIRWDKEADI